MKNLVPLLMLIFFGSAYQANAQQAVTVDVANVVNDVSQKPIGINMNYLMDGSYLNPAISTTQSIKNMGVKFMRFPGGEKADNYLWSIPPFTAPNPHFARTGSCEWPSNDTRFANSDYSTVKPSGLDFDEFMTMCQSAGGTPLIVVAYDGMYKPATCGTKPTKAQLIQTAVEWVRYANITKHYNIKYWMIGNESWKSCDYNGCATAAQYRDDIIQFAQQMKAVDPTIKIIANGETSSWWSTVLPTASPYIDYLGLSNYPIWQYTGGYSHYQNNTNNFMGVVNTAVNAINSYAQAADRARIKIISTEYNSMDWQGSWADANDLGHALASFEMLGEHLKHPRVEAALLWNTRWVNNATKANDLYDAIDKNGNLEANGKAFSIWGKNLKTKMVAVNSTTYLRNYASYDPIRKELSIFIVNKASGSQTINLDVRNYMQSASFEQWKFAGSGPSDLNPSLTRVSYSSMTSPKKTITVPGVSITLVKFKPTTLIASSLSLSRSRTSGQRINLNWTAEDEGTVGQFVVERSFNKEDFSPINAVAFNGTGKYSYADIDVPEGEKPTYRIRTVTEENEEVVSEPKGLIETVSLEGMQVYPNPAKDKVSLDLQSSMLVPLKVKAFSADGKLCFDDVLDPEKGEMKMDVSDWAKGMYILQVEAEEQKAIRKIVVE
jgi:alpha-L-arabinofuranosidase